MCSGTYSGSLKRSITSSRMAPGVACSTLFIHVVRIFA